MYDLEEQEQIDALKAWWKAHSNLVMTVLVAACLAAGATAGWRWYRTNQAEQAAHIYGTLEKAIRANDAKTIKDTAGQLMDKYGSTAYGSMAALMPGPRRRWRSAPARATPGIASAVLRRRARCRRPHPVAAAGRI